MRPPGAAVCLERYATAYLFVCVPWEASFYDPISHNADAAAAASAGHCGKTSAFKFKVRLFSVPTIRPSVIPSFASPFAVRLSVRSSVCPSVRRFVRSSVCPSVRASWQARVHLTKSFFCSLNDHGGNARLFWILSLKSRCCRRRRRRGAHAPLKSVIYTLNREEQSDYDRPTDRPLDQPSARPPASQPASPLGVLDVGQCSLCVVEV